MVTGTLSGSVWKRLRYSSLTSSSERKRAKDVEPLRAISGSWCCVSIRIFGFDKRYKKRSIEAKQLHGHNKEISLFFLSHNMFLRTGQYGPIERLSYDRMVCNGLRL